jgi:hypothetical protein
MIRVTARSRSPPPPLPDVPMNARGESIRLSRPSRITKKITSTT